MKHDPEYHDRLERLIDLELKRLPQLQAPGPLFQRVMSAIEAEQRKPWWQKPWSCWPLNVQIFFLASLCILAGSLVYALSLAPTDASVHWMSAKIGSAYDVLATAGGVLMTILNALILVLTTAFSSWAMIAIAAAAFLYASSVALGVAWFRIALNRRAFNFKFL